MDDILIALGCASLVTWGVLLLFRHGFWRMDQKLSGNVPDPDHWPDVIALVPARNEEASVAQCLSALARQDYPGRFCTIVINDGSTDKTADVAGLAARDTADHDHRVKVIDAPPLQPGWAGKLWALQCGIDHVASGSLAADYFWFTDADIVHEPDTLRRLVAKAAAEDLAMVSLMVRLACKSPWERLLVPAFIFFFQMLYPFRAVNDPSQATAGAAGGCILLRRRALEHAGGLLAMKNRLIDDCALGALIKADGHRIWLGLADRSYSLRRYTELADFWQMVARSAFVQLKHSTCLLVGSIAGMIVTFIIAPLIVATYLLHGEPTAATIAAISWILMSLAYVPAMRYHGLASLNALLLAPAAGLYIVMTIDSARRHWTGRGANWKNRAYQSK